MISDTIQSWLEVHLHLPFKRNGAMTLGTSPVRACHRRYVWKHHEVQPKQSHSQRCQAGKRSLTYTFQGSKRSKKQ